MAPTIYNREVLCLPIFMITTKYTYPKLTRYDSESGRTYASDDGIRIPSVTTILSATKSEESKKALLEWRKRLGDREANSVTAESSGRGTRMHKFLEELIINDTMPAPGSNPYSKQSHQMAQTILKYGLCNVSEYWGSEVSLYYPEIYSGTTDLICVHNGTPCIADFKQTNKPKKREYIADYFIQLCSYAIAHNKLFGTSINKGVIFMCSADNQYQEFIIDGEEFNRYSEMWWDRVHEYYAKLP